LTKREIASVLAELHRKAPRSTNTRMNLMIFRLACCAGLRVTEIGGLQLADVRTEIDKPHINIRPAIAKGRRWAQGSVVVGQGHAGGRRGVGGVQVPTRGQGG